MQHRLSGFFKKGSFPLFILIGMVNTLFGYAVFAIVIACDGHYLLASFVSLCLGILFNFQTLGKIVFDHPKKNLFFRFLGMYAFIYLLSISLLRLNSVIVSNLYLNGLIVTILVAFVSFILNKYIVFRK